MIRVLLVDDEPGIIEALALALTESGMDVSTATNGKCALESIALQRPDVVLSDWMMPVMDGKALAHALKGAPELSGIPMLMMSALQPDGCPPVDGFLQKPFAVAKLLQLIDLHTHALPDEGAWHQ